jgi:Na+(H+)/acetate symporter ActP
VGRQRGSVRPCQFPPRSGWTSTRSTTASSGSTSWSSWDRLHRPSLRETSLDYFLSGRSLPAWITGLAFVSANLGATEILGNGANGARYGIATVNYSWIGAIPAMVFLGLVMMPFYYGSKVRSVPEYLLKRFDQKSHIFNSLTFALATVLIAGVNLFALALVLQLLLGWPIILGIVVAAGIVLAYITLGGLSSAIYNEVLQFFVILAALIPLTIVGLHDSGGWSGLKDHVRDSKLGEARRGCTRCRARASATWSTRSARRGSGSSSASASCSRSAAGRRTSPRSSAASRRATSRPPSAPR